MMRSFQQYNHNVPCYEVSSINVHTGAVSQFSYNIVNHNNKSYLLKYSTHETTLDKQGWNTFRQYYKYLRKLGYSEFNLSDIEQLPLWDRTLLNDMSDQEIQELQQSIV